MKESKTMKYKRLFLTWCMAGFLSCVACADSFTTNQMWQALQVTDYLATQCTNGTVETIYSNYFNKNKLFSTKDTLNSNGLNISPVLNTNMNERFTFARSSNAGQWANGTWRIYKCGPGLTSGELGFNVFVTPQVITNASVGTPITWVLKYNTESKKYSVCTAVVADLLLGTREEPDAKIPVQVISGPQVIIEDFDVSTLTPSDESDPTTPASLAFGQPFSLIVFGDFETTGGDFRQAALAWGNAKISGVSIGTDYSSRAEADNMARDVLIVGGDFDDQVRSICGNIAFGGTCTTNVNYIVPYVRYHASPVLINAYGNVSETNGISQSEMYAQVKAVSDDLAKRTVNGTVTVNEEIGVTKLMGSDETQNVFSVDAAQWTKVVNLDIPTNSLAVVNIYGETVEGRVTNIRINGDDQPSEVMVTNVVFNFVNAQTITIGAEMGGTANYNGMFLAPFADVNWRGGNAYGPVIIGGNLTCSNLQFSCKGFNGYGLKALEPTVEGTDPVSVSDKATTYNIIVERPDFAITEMSWIDRPTLTGEVMTVFVTVKNNGQVAADAGTLAIYASAKDSVAVGTEGTEEIAAGVIEPGSTKTFSVTLNAAPEQGTHHVRAFIDSWDNVLEWSNGDNQMTLMYEVDPIELIITFDTSVVTLQWNNFWGQKYTLLGRETLDLTEDWTPISGCEGIESARPEKTNTKTIEGSSYRFFKLRVDQR